MSNTKKVNVMSNTAQKYICYILLATGIILVFIAMFMPPIGIIDVTVCGIFAQILLFIGSLLGIDMKYNSKLLGLLKKEEKELEKN